MNYWRDHWEMHAKRTRDAPPQLQVQRTWQKQPVSDDVFQQLVAALLALVKPAETHRCLDLCCGNGLITTELARRTGQVVAVDFAADLLAHIDQQAIANIVTLHCDVRQCQFEAHSFDRIVLYAGLQYLTHAETVTFLCRLRPWLRPGGRIVLGDIPDQDRMWNFFDTPERCAEYFRQLERGEPIVGTWFSPAWLRRLAAHAGFQHATVVAQSPELPYHHFRFDLVCDVANHEDRSGEDNALLAR